MTRKPRTPAERVEDTECIVMAVRLAVHEAMLAKKKLGHTAIAGIEGRVVEIPPDEIDVDEAEVERERREFEARCRD